MPSPSAERGGYLGKFQFLRDDDEVPTMPDPKAPIERDISMYMKKKVRGGVSWVSTWVSTWGPARCMCPPSLTITALRTSTPTSTPLTTPRLDQLTPQAREKEVDAEAIRVPTKRATFVIKDTSGGGI